MKAQQANIFSRSTLSRFRHNAFTLIELLVVVAVILVLVGISLKVMSIVNVKTGTARTLFVLEQTRNALDAYYSTVGTYPNTLDTKYDRLNGNTNSWGFDASLDPNIPNIKGLTYYLGYEPNPRAASWQKFASTVIVSGASHTNKPSTKPGFDKIITTNTVNTIVDGWGTEIIYTPTTNCDGFSLYSAGPDGNPNTKIDNIGIDKNE